MYIYGVHILCIYNNILVYYCVYMLGLSVFILMTIILVQCLLLKLSIMHFVITQT